MSFPSRSPEGIEQTTEGARQIVRSPEQVELHLPVAGPASRILAYVIDWLVIGLLMLALVLALGFGFVATGFVTEWLGGPLSEFLDAAESDDPESVITTAFFLLLVLAFLMVQLVAEWAYFVTSEMASGGRSIGKAVVGLRVVEDGGRPIGFRASLVRNLLRIADVLPTSYLAGLISMVVSPEGKRLGDIAAGTLVVRLDRPAPAPPLPSRGAERVDEFRFDRAAIARLGGNERTLLRQTLRRLETLSGEEAERALERACEALCARLERPVPPPADRMAFLQALLRASRGR